MVVPLPVGTADSAERSRLMTLVNCEGEGPTGSALSPKLPHAANS
jgi:hypothetical protein